MASELTGNYISNTFQKLLQVDPSLPSNGNVPFNINDAINNDYHTLVNGFAQKHQGVVIDQGGNDGGIFLKNTSQDPNVVYGMRYEGDGLKIFRRSSVEDQKLYIKNTGTVWVGDNYTPTADFNNHNLYVDKGIYFKENNDRSFITVGDGTSNAPNGRLYISAKNHYLHGEDPAFQQDGNDIRLGQVVDEAILESGIYFFDQTGQSPTEPYSQTIYQRIGNVVKCHTIYNHKAGNANGKFPIYIDGFGGCSTVVIGNGVNNANGGFGVEVQGTVGGNGLLDGYKIVNPTNSGHIWNNSFSRISWSYNLVPQP